MGEVEQVLHVLAAEHVTQLVSVQAKQASL